MAKLLCICIGFTKFKENPEGSSILCVDLTWNDPFASQSPVQSMHGEDCLILEFEGVAIMKLPYLCTRKQDPYYEQVRKAAFRPAGSDARIVYTRQDYCGY